MVSCLASRSGTKSDSFAIDYQATLNCLEAAKKEGANHFVMLSAFCVKKPLLQVIVVCVELRRAAPGVGNPNPFQERPTSSGALLPHRAAVFHHGVAASCPSV